MIVMGDNYNFILRVGTQLIVDIALVCLMQNVFCYFSCLFVELVW